MKNILIFAGGTGSIALQSGLHHLYGPSLKVDVVISAYDNGKSTGECRKVFQGKILGPSDLRKNQITQFKLRNRLDDSNTSETAAQIMCRLFEDRYTRVKWQDSYTYAITQTQKAFAEIRAKETGNSNLDRKEEILIRLINFFFFDEYASLERNVRPSILTANLSDFSISNIYYASAAALNGNSLAKAGKLMSEILDIPDNVHLISDVNLYLNAKTRQGNIISDEGKIVAYDNPCDPICSAVLLDEKGVPYTPSVDEGIETGTTTSELISRADIIIFSSGTQWSSLIPTYMHKGFKEKIKSSKAAKYLVMNNKEDRDMKGIDANGLLNIVKEYLPMEDIKIVVNTNADKSMSTLDAQWNSQTTYAPLSVQGSKTHDPLKLAGCIIEDYYAPYLGKPFYYFDFDDTIWSSSKDVLMRKISKENLELLYKAFLGKFILISGNSDSHFTELEDKFTEAFRQSEVKDENGFLLYCNGGNCVYQIRQGHIAYLYNIIDDYNLNDDYFKLTDKILEALRSGGWNLNISNFENRGNCILSIKPLKNRPLAKKIIDQVIQVSIPLQHGCAKYAAYINGNTTIDIMNADYNKGVIAKLITEQHGLQPSNIVYVGDKTDSGNDSCILDLGYKVLPVDDVADFNVFAKTYFLHKK